MIMSWSWSRRPGVLIVATVTMMTSVCGNLLPEGTTGCCPYMPSLASTHAEIEAYVGCGGNVAVSMDYGGPNDVIHPWRHRCQSEDKGFLWIVDWGDGINSTGQHENVHAFHTTHTYASVAQYTVKVFYCSDPDPEKKRLRCCNSLINTIQTYGCPV